MSETTAITYQCDKCKRQHDGAGLAWAFHRGEARWVRQPEMADCNTEDCAAVADANDQREQRKAERQRARWKERHPAKGCPRSNVQRPKSGAREPLPAQRLPHPVDSEDTRTVQPIASSPKPIDGLAHAAEQSRFVAEGDGLSDCEKMLEILFGNPDSGFRPDDVTRTSRGPWVTSHDLKYQHGIETPNSRASQLRGSATLEAHPLVKKFDLDIDCRRNPAEYSVCFREHSERLARERAAQANDELKNAGPRPPDVRES